MEIIKSSSASLLQLISDLLDSQKLELGQLRINKSRYDIQKVINKSIETLQPQADEKQTTITNHNNKEIILAHDPERIGQVLTNLIKNSIKAMPPDKKGLVEIFVEESTDEVKISVKDNGIGIPKDKQKELFKKFYQVDASLTRELGGSGLGLSICKGIVETHNGKIWVESTPEKGSTFTFTLPKTESNETDHKPQKINENFDKKQAV